MKRLLWFLPTALLLLLDRLTKLWAADALTLGESRPLLGEIFHLTRVHNVGGAFGIFPGAGTLFIAVSALVAVVIFGLILSPRIRSLVLRFGLLILLAGAVGNLIDRIAIGHVLDFLEVRIPGLALVALVGVVCLAAFPFLGRVRGFAAQLGTAAGLIGALGVTIHRSLHGLGLDFVFNVADACVTVGAVLIVVYILFGGEGHSSRGQTDRP